MHVVSGGLHGQLPSFQVTVFSGYLLLRPRSASLGSLYRLLAELKWERSTQGARGDSTAPLLKVRTDSGSGIFSLDYHNWLFLAPANQRSADLVFPGFPSSTPRVLPSTTFNVGI
jgi:hypothetical protein